MRPGITAVKANPDFTLDILFENGEERIFDMKPYLSIGVFRQLKDYTKFKKVKPFFGSIAWATEQDLCHDTLYLESKKAYRLKAKRTALIAAEPRATYRRRKK